MCVAIRSERPAYHVKRFLKYEGDPAEVQAPPNATVVPVRPGDVVPEPEVANPPPQDNDPLVPEKPQTARWQPSTRCVC